MIHWTRRKGGLLRAEDEIRGWLQAARATPKALGSSIKLRGEEERHDVAGKPPTQRPFAVGAGFGSTVGFLLGTSIALAAILGMAGYFAGVVQAPMTALVIILEMTGDPQPVIPIMWSLGPARPQAAPIYWHEFQEESGPPRNAPIATRIIGAAAPPLGDGVTGIEKCCRSCIIEE